MSPCLRTELRSALGGGFHLPFSRGYNPLLNGRLAKPTLATLNDGASPLLNHHAKRQAIFSGLSRFYHNRRLKLCQRGNCCAERFSRNQCAPFHSSGGALFTGVDKMYKILIVDDEANIREVLKEYAEFEGHEVSEACDGMQAVEMAKNNDYDIIVMDVMMPKLDGFSACKEIRKLKSTPVLMLSARGEEYDKLFGFELGIDDYVVKPFSPKEVMARINAIIKRSSGGSSASEEAADTVRFEGLEINFTSRDVYIDGKKASLTPKEYDLLFYIVRNKNIALTRNRLLEEVWGYDFFGDDRTIDTHIKMLRNNLGPYRKFIVTLRGMGYKFEV